MKLLPQSPNTRLICVFMAYGHFWDACHRQAYQTWSWASPECVEDPHGSRHSGV